MTNLSRTDPDKPAHPVTECGVSCIGGIRESATDGYALYLAPVDNPTLTFGSFLLHPTETREDTHICMFSKCSHQVFSPAHAHHGVWSWIDRSCLCYSWKRGPAHKVTHLSLITWWDSDSKGQNQDEATKWWHSGLAFVKEFEEMISLWTESTGRWTWHSAWGERQPIQGLFLVPLTSSDLLRHLGIASTTID